MSFDNLAKVKIIPGISIFVSSFIVIFIALSLFDTIPNKYVLALIYSALAIILLQILLVYNGLNKIPASLSGSNMIRYTMLCHNCNWEWMSNTTDKNSPTKCPTCGERSKLELVGYRKVQKLPKKSNKDLTSFFKEK
jgi:hypothetical protein|tara:strand:+ start:189 stop:599 length:411 start_codon:yes stop_codon:yes gene_type:complete